MKLYVVCCLACISAGLSYGTAIAQRININSDHRSVSIVTVDRDIETIIFQKKKVSTCRAKYYHWYNGQAINITQGDYSGSILDGIYSEYKYPGKALICKGYFKKGLKHGLWLSWYTDGQLKCSEKWKNGWLHGDKYVYNDSGVVIKTEKYKKGVLICCSSDTVKRKSFINRLHNWYSTRIKKRSNANAKTTK